MINIIQLLVYAVGALTAAVVQTDREETRFLWKRSGEEVNLASLTYDNILLRAPSCSMGNSSVCLKSAINGTISTFFAASPHATDNIRLATSVIEDFIVTFHWLTFDEADKAFAAFDQNSARLENLVDIVTNFALQNSSSEFCLDLFASGGLLNHGVVTISTDGTVDGASKSRVEDRLLPPYADCGLGRIYHDGWNTVIQEL
ncbi:hypothetical protein HII31_08242 [Pseudocercospora fuligena]|uniref:Uncharacterized protein n=1 Tax=Pseudocercospora fuligena TaxID=685502 RepID=A0A8H6VFM3_9PEZI|nr:hypothetical protein HII31_08242 [Pseudocercospora fuligena]